MRLSAGLFCVLVLPLGAWGKTCPGVVVDPQQRVIVGARVVLTCGGHTETTETDAQGQFSFSPQTAQENCALSVNQPGFAPHRRFIRGEPGDLLIQLELARPLQVINILPQEDGALSVAGSSLGSVSLSRAELQQISNNTPDLIDHARLLAGAPPGADNIYVDGLPSRTLPLAETIERVAVNPDPFSAEYADGRQNHIDIMTKSPDRRFRFNFGGASLGLGGGSVLVPGLRSASRSGSFGITGPMPRLPLTFSLQASLSHSQRDQPIRAITLEPVTLAAPTISQNGSIFFAAHYSGSETVRANFAFYDSSNRGSNAGVGGLTLPEAGMGHAFAAREARAAFQKTGRQYLYRAGFVFNRTDSQSWANSTRLGLTVLGSFVAGGAGTSERRVRDTSWTLKNVLQPRSSTRFWSAGVTISRAEDSYFERPNPVGVIQFGSLQAYADALAGAPAGTWFGARGNGHVRYASTAAAPFIEAEVFRAPNATVRGGMRADYQTKGGLVFSPRLSAAATLRRFTFRGGAGVFVQNWSNDVFVRTLIADGFHLQRFFVEDASFEDAAGAIRRSDRAIVSRFDPDLVRPRDLMLRGSVERGLSRSLVAGVEYTSMNGLHLLGSRRLRTENGWMDLLESDRLLRSHHLHARVRYGWKNHTLVGHYRWIRSYDNTGGPFSFPERQSDVRAEWARTAGVSPHNFSLVGKFKLPGAVSLTLVAISRSSAPYNVISGRDDARNGLYNDRAGRPRNSGKGPTYNSQSLYFHRRVMLLRFFARSKDKTYLTVGLRIENVLDNKNFSSLGSVVNSPLFGMPLTALPGRAVRMWLGFDQ